MATTPIWTPSPQRVAATRLSAFQRHIEATTGLRHDGYDALHRWSIEDAAAFSTAVWQFTGVIGDPGARAAVDTDRMPGGRFFPDARLNFAENVLRRRDDGPAIIAYTESSGPRVVSFAALAKAVGRAATALAADGVGAGDRVCAIAATSAPRLEALRDGVHREVATRHVVLDRDRPVGDDLEVAVPGPVLRSARGGVRSMPAGTSRRISRSRG